MKTFYGGRELKVSDTSYARNPSPDSSDLFAQCRASVAVYDDAAAAPLVEYIDSAPARDYIEELSVLVYDLASRRGGKIPYTVIREIVENFIHAGFAEPVVSVLDDGNTIRFSDQGPGIRDKERAVLPGYTTARAGMKGVIRGVGSGLPLVREFLSVSKGSLSIEDNLGGGCVITVCTKRDVSPTNVAVSGFSAGLASAASPANETSSLFSNGESEVARTILTNRQKQVLALVLENGTAGPSIVSRELGVGLSTAYRDLASLEEAGLISSDSGKRTLTSAGLSFISSISSSR